MKCASCRWAIERDDASGWCYCARDGMEYKRRMLGEKECSAWQIRDDCRYTNLLCSNYSWRNYKEDVFEICKKCMKL